MITSVDDDYRSFVDRLEYIENAVVQCVHRRATGAYIHGRPGIGKSETVLRKLMALGASFHRFKGEMSPKGLFDAMQEFHSSVIILDDLSIMDKKDARYILLAATDGDPSRPRMVTHTTSGAPLTCLFAGSIIILSNDRLKSSPFGSRVLYRMHYATDEEVAAFMLQLAGEGVGELSAEHSIEVAHFLIDHAEQAGVRLDLRNLSKSCGIRKSAEERLFKTHTWEQEVLKELENPSPGQHAKLVDERKKVLEALKKFPDSKDWQKRCEHAGLKKTTYYAVMKLLKTSGIV